MNCINKREGTVDNMIKQTLKRGSAFVAINKIRMDNNLNPLCPGCGRVMRTKHKGKYHKEVYCICSKDLVVSIG